MKGTFLTEKFLQDIESEDDSFATLRGQEFFANESSITNRHLQVYGEKYFYAN